MGVLTRARRLHADGSRALDAALALRQLLNPIRRHTLPGIPRGLVIAGVWPDGRGFAARLDAPRRPGIPIVWARWRDGLEAWTFPDDPVLTALPRLTELGYQPLTHRLGRGATLGAADRSHVLHLRSARSAAQLFQSWTLVHETLANAGVPVPALGPREPKVPAIRSEWLPVGSPNGPPDVAAMEALGDVVARVHGTPPPPGLLARGPGPALDATVRQVVMAAYSQTAFTQWLERRLERWKLLGTAPRPATALVHGDLRMDQIAWRATPIVVDWERTGPGDPEEDLGSLAADLFWRHGASAAPKFAAFRAAHRARHGDVSRVWFEYYARLSLVKRLASRALSEPDQAMLRARQSEWAEWPDVVGGW